MKKTGFFDIFGSTVFSKVVSFLSTIVLVRLVTKSQYGIFTYSWNIYSIAILFSGCGMCSAILQLACENHNDVKSKNAIYSYGMKYGALFNILLCIIILLIAFLYPFKLDGIRTMLLILALLPMAQYFSDYQIAYLRTEKKNHQYAILNCLNVTLVFAFSVMGAFIIQEKGFVVSRYIAFIILILFGYYAFHIPFNFRKDKITKQQSKDMWHIAVVSMINTGISQLLYLLDVFVLGIIIPNSTVVASYKVATIIPTALSFIPIALVTYVYPYFAENKNNSKWCLKRYKLILLGMGSINLFISLVLVIFAPMIVKLAFGSQYSDAVIPFRILSISYFFSGTFRVIAGNLLVTQRKLGFNFIVAFSSGLLNIVADVILIMNMGSSGAAIATLIVVIFTSVLNVTYLFYSFSHVGRKKNSEVNL